MPRHVRFDIEDEQGTETDNTTHVGDPFFLPAIEAGINPGPNPLDRSDEQRGVDGRQKLAPNEYEPDGSLVMRNYLNELGALLLVQFGDVVSTPGDGIITDPAGDPIPAGATRHVFSKLTGVRPRSGRITDHYGSSYFEGRGVTIPEIAFGLDEDGVKATASLMVNYIRRLTSEPSGGEPSDYTDFDILPMRRRNVVVDWGVGTENIDSIDFSFAQALEYVRDMGSATGWPTDTERANSVEGFLALTGSLNRRQIDNADWDALIDADSFAVVISMVSEQAIASGYPYKMFVEAPAVQFPSGTPEGLKNQARHSAEFDWTAAYDEDEGYDFQVTLVNEVDDYEVAGS